MNIFKTRTDVKEAVVADGKAQDQQLRAIFKAGDMASEPSARLERRVTEQAARHAEQQVRIKTRRTIFQRGFAMSAATALIIIAATSWPKIAAAQALRRVEAALAEVRTARLVQWVIAPDGSRAKISERWFQDGKMRAEELRPDYQAGHWTKQNSEPARIQIFDDGVLKTYDRARNRVLVQHRKTPFDGPGGLDGQSSEGFSLSTIAAQWSKDGKPRLLDDATENGRTVRRMLVEPPEGFMRFLLIADAETDLLNRMEWQVKKQGQWTTMVIIESTFNQALPAQLFEPDFPRTAQVVRVDNEPAGGKTEEAVSLAWAGFSRDKTLLATQGNWVTKSNSIQGKREIKVWDVSTSALLRTFKLQHHPLKLALSPDGSTLVTIGFGRDKGKPGGKHRPWVGAELEVRDVATGKQLRILRPFPWGFAADMEPIAFAPDSKTLATALTRHKLNEQKNEWEMTLSLSLINVQTGKVEKAVKFPNMTCLDIEFSPDHRWLALAGSKVFLCDGRSGALRRSLEARSSRMPNRMKFSADGSVLVTQNTVKTPNPGRNVITDYPLDTQIKLWDTTTGKLKRTLVRPSCMGGAVAVSPDGKLVAMSGMQEVFMGGDQVWVWDTQSGEVIAQLPLPEGTHSESPDRALEFTADGRSLIYPHHEGGFLQLDVPIGR